MIPTLGCSSVHVGAGSARLFFVMPRIGMRSSQRLGTSICGVTICGIPGLTWMADAGVPVHVLRKIAGHGSLTTTQRYLHPDLQTINDAGTSLTEFLKAVRSPGGPRLWVA